MEVVAVMGRPGRQHFTRALRQPPELIGIGYLAGQFPDGITSVEGVPSPAVIRVVLRLPGKPADGYVVADVKSAPDGTWLVEGLNPDLKFDVICRHEGYNDMILSNVSPVLATGLDFSGSFATLDDQVEILLGTGPYHIDVVGGTPPFGVTFTAQGNFIVATGVPGNWGEFAFTLRVIDSKGLSGVFESMVYVAEPVPTIIGESFGGGFYAGDIESGGQWYKLIVADVSADTIRTWKTTNSDTPGTDHLVDGVSNTNAMITAGIELHPAAAHCIDHQGGGFGDWYMPAQNELNVVYQNLGHDRPNCPPDFQAGGPQAFSAAYYLASTQYLTTFGRCQHLGSGYRNYFGKTYPNQRVRPARRIPFTP